METATWCWTPAAASAASTLRPEVSKNASTAWSSQEGALARSITTCVPAMASVRPSPVMLLTPVVGEAATTSWPLWRRMATAFEPMRPVPPMTTIFIVYPPLSMRRGMSNAIVPQSRWACTPWAGGRGGSGGVTPQGLVVASWCCADPPMQDHYRDTFRFHFLPPHCGHHLNPIGGFWRVMKDTIGAGRCFADLHLLYQRTRHVLMAHQERPIYEFHW